MATALDSIISGIKADQGLKAETSATRISRGVAAADDLNTTLLKVIAATNVNADGRITAADMMKISDGTYANPADYVDFLEAHGNDNGTVTTGFHYVQNDGGTLMFQGRNFIDTVADAIYHYGFDIQNGRYFNEDGNDNETAIDVAGWLNFFLNGENIVYGTVASEELGSGKYSSYFAKAANETFEAGAGNDKVWADVGADTVWAGTGNDTVGGGSGNDKIYGGAGIDKLWGEAGADKIYGEAGADQMGGGLGNDIMDGGDDADTLYGDEGADQLFGGSGVDKLSGGKDSDTLTGGSSSDSLMGDAGNDKLYGESGSDKLYAGDGADYLRGGSGADKIYLWESVKARDTLDFNSGDSGKTLGTIDRVEGFVSGQDKIDLRSFGGMTFEAIDFEGGGQASTYYDGKYLRIDANGDGASDMLIEFAWVNKIVAGDLLLA
jgi:Ca2+-binding RTX toxin-like protein